MLYTESWYFFSKVGNTFSFCLPNGLDVKNISLASEHPESCLTCQAVMYRPLRPLPLKLLRSPSPVAVYGGTRCNLWRGCV